MEMQIHTLHKLQVFDIIQSDPKQTDIFEMTAILLWVNLCKKSN